LIRDNPGRPVPEGTARQLHVDSDAFIASVAEIISDIREPITVQQQDMGREERRQLDLKVGL